MALGFGTKNAVIFGGLKSEACYFLGLTENILNWASPSKFMQSPPPRAFFVLANTVEPR